MTRPAELVRTPGRRSLTPAIVRVAGSLPPTGIDGQAAALRAHVLDWTLSAGLDDTTLARWATARHDWLLCRMYPAAELPTRRVAADAVLWLFLADGYTGPGAPGDDPAYSGHFARTTAAIMAGEGPDRAPADPLLRRAWELAVNPARPRSPWWRRRLHGHLAAFAAGMHREVEDRARGRVPSIDEYIDRRRITSGWDVLADFGEATLAAFGQVPLAPPVLAGSDEYRRLRLAGGDIAFAINDLLSLAREREAGEYHNLVLVTRQAHGGPAEAAVDWVDRWLRSRLDDYLSARAGLLAEGEAGARDAGAPGAGAPGAAAAGAAAAGSLVAAMDAVVRGPLDWSLETGRY